MAATPNSAMSRRRRSVVMDQTGSPTVLSASKLNVLEENNDQEERRQRRKSKLLSNNLASPAVAVASPARQPGEAEKRKSIGNNNGMSNAQISDHYASCIKLSSENKINAKNAFGLHLIDYMKDLLKQSQKESTTNFQIASCTLDAGVKIYGYRVDSIHSEAYKVLGSLGRAVDNPEEEGGDEAADNGSQEGDGGEGPARKQPKKKRQGKTIETNFKNINCEELDVDFDVDPFFQKTSAAFDEGGTSGLLSFQLRSKSDKNDLMMDSQMKINPEKPPAPEEGTAAETPAETTEDNTMIDLKSLRDMYNALPFDAMEICPAFKSFKFTGWDTESMDVGGNCKLPEDNDDDNLENPNRFDQNAPAMPDPMEESIGGGGDYGGDWDDMGDDDDMEMRDGQAPLGNSVGLVRFDEAGEALPNNTTKKSTFNLTNAGQLELSLCPSEYSYFSDDILSAWAGPLHWKLKPRSKDLTGTTAASKKSNRKEAMRIDFDLEIDMKKHFGTGRAATHLKESTLEKLGVHMTILPEDMHYELSSFYKLFFKPGLMVKRQKKDPATILDGGTDELYNYDNPNDRENFVGDLLPEEGGVGDNTQYADDDFGDGGYEDADGDVTAGGDMLMNLDGSQNNLWSGDNLVSQPNKVRVLDINYAKSAKRIDIKRLMGHMWKMLCEKKPEDKENDMEAAQMENNRPVPEIPAGEGAEGDDLKVSGLYNFKSMYETLPSKVSSNMAKNLSCPIAFVCLLYLANQKTLKLESTDKMDDIRISEGI